MAAIGYSCSRSLFSVTKLNNPIDVRSRSSYIKQCYHTGGSECTKNYNSNGVGIGCCHSVADNRFVRGNCVGAFGYGLLHSGMRHGVPYRGIGFVKNYRSYSSAISSQSNAQGEVPVVFVGNDWTDKMMEFWKSTTVNGVTYTGEKGTEVSVGVTHPHLRSLLMIYTLMCTSFAIIVLPKILKRFHECSMQDPVEGSVPYEESFLGALEDPLRCIISFMAYFSPLAMIEPAAAQNIDSVWRRAVIISFVWFLYRWKANVLARALAMKSMDSLDRNKLFILDKISSVGLFGIGLIAFVAHGLAVQSILVIGGVAIAFVIRDVLEIILSGLSVQISQPFSIGDTIKAGSVEGQAVEMGLTTTSSRTAEKLPVIVNKSPARCQGMVTEIPFQIGDLDKIPNILEDIKTMLKANTNVFLEEEAPYYFLSQRERAFAELTIGCNLKFISKEQFLSAQQDILFQSLGIIKKYGGYTLQLS